MNRLLFVGILFLLIFPAVAGAGGSVPATYGNVYGGNTYIPKSDNVITWSAYGEPLSDPVLRDILAAATASIDRETQSFRLLHEMHPELSKYHVYFSFVGGDPSPKCLDDTPGGCTLGQFTCMQWDIEGPYRVCSVGRIRINTSNIATGGSVEERLPNIIRHEWSHVLGFDDNEGGPTGNGGDKFTECQLAQMRDFDYEETIQGWTIIDPAECE